jgi:hypothetical protein
LSEKVNFLIAQATPITRLIMTNLPMSGVRKRGKLILELGKLRLNLGKASEQFRPCRKFLRRAEL